MNRGNSSLRMKVVAHRPWRGVAIAAIAVSLAVVGGLLGYVFAHGQHAYTFSSNDNFESQSTSATQRVEEMERQLADIRLGGVVDGEANESLRQTIKTLRDELSASQDEVLFYRQLMAPSEAQRGLRIEKLALTLGVNPGEVKYRLLLTQVVERSEWATGNVTVDILGNSENEQVVLPLTEMTQVESYPLTFRFRYFQDFMGTLLVPAGLKPEQVVVTAATSGRNPKRVQKTFTWTLEED